MQRSKAGRGENRVASPLSPPCLLAAHISPPRFAPGVPWFGKDEPHKFRIQPGPQPGPANPWTEKSGSPVSPRSPVAAKPSASLRSPVATNPRQWSESKINWGPFSPLVIPSPGQVPASLSPPGSSPQPLGSQSAALVARRIDFNIRPKILRESEPIAPKDIRTASSHWRKDIDSDDLQYPVVAERPWCEQLWSDGHMQTYGWTRGNDKRFDPNNHMLAAARYRRRLQELEQSLRSCQSRSARLASLNFVVKYFTWILQRDLDHAARRFGF